MRYDVTKRKHLTHREVYTKALLRNFEFIGGVPVCLQERGVTSYGEE